MYAFTSDLQEAWNALFEPLHHFLPSPYDQPLTLIFEDQDAYFLEPEFLIGHTCGYPFVKKWHTTHDLVCIPIFDIAGCRGRDYSSWIIARHDHQGEKLEDFKGSVATMNNPDSNSGMNVFRYEISKICGGKNFFSDVVISHSHLTSIAHVLERKADIAAIDAVTWHFAKHQGELNLDEIKIIGQTVETPGLPLVKPKSCSLDSKTITQALNTSLGQQSEELRGFLKISEFREVNSDDYTFILDLENQAINNQLPELR